MSLENSSLSNSRSWIAPCASLVCLCRAALAFVSSSAMTLQRQHTFKSLFPIKRAFVEHCESHSISPYSFDLFLYLIPAGQELAPPNITLDTHPLQLLCCVCQTATQSLILQNQLVLLPRHSLKVVLEVIPH